MRIITGTYKGRLLKSPADRTIRPATDRVKGTIFNMLQNRLGIGGASVLDLFAGSGNLGFEAISRGADMCVFVDDARASLAIVEENARSLDCLPQCEIVHDDALSFIARGGRSFDLIFADPPYSYDPTPEIPEKIFQNGLLRDGGYLIIEHHKKAVIPPSRLCALAAQKQFGSTRVSFFVHPTLKKDSV